MADTLADDDDALFWLLALAVAGAAVYFARNMQAAAAEIGGPSFENYAPDTGATFGNIMDVLLPMQVSPAGVAMVASFEGFRAMAYPDAGGQAIGYGHVIGAGENIEPPITQAEGLALLAGDLAAVAASLNSLVTVSLSQAQFDALASLVYNIGPGAFANSTLLADLNAGDYASAAQQFARWNQSGGTINAGLAQRRADEQQFFST